MQVRGITGATRTTMGLGENPCGLPASQKQEEGRHLRGMVPTFFYETEGEERVCLVLPFVSHIYRIPLKCQKYVE